MSDEPTEETPKAKPARKRAPAKKKPKAVIDVPILSLIPRGFAAQASERSTEVRPEPDLHGLGHSPFAEEA